MAADRVEKLFKKQTFQYEIRDCERDFESTEDSMDCSISRRKRLQRRWPLPRLSGPI